MKGISRVFLLIAISGSVFAKAPNPLCLADVGASDFSGGNGAANDPYIICNHTQFGRIGAEPELLNKFFQLGSDLDYANHIFMVIGSEATPFTGGFNGDNYTLLSVIMPRDRQMYLAPFGYIKGGKLENLAINGMSIDSNEHAGGMVGYAFEATLDNLHIDSLNLRAGQFSGGLVGELANSHLTNSSVNGVMEHLTGTHANGGLVGYALNSDISTSRSSVIFYADSKDASDLSEIGGLIGKAEKSNIENVYAKGGINYSNIPATTSLKQLGGLIGSISKGSLKFAYSACRMTLNSDNETIGGLVGDVVKKTTSKKLFWDTQVSGVNHSALGQGMTEHTLKTKSFWVSKGFDETLWMIQSGDYPKLYKADGLN